MQFNLFGWIRDGVRRSVILGVNDAIEEIGSPDGDATWKEQMVTLLQSRAVTEPGPISGVTTAKRKRLGRSLKDSPPE